MIIEKPAVKIEAGRVVLSAGIHFDRPQDSDPAEVWFSYPEKFAPFVSTRADTFLLAMLIPAMVRNESITVRGEVSPRLLFGTQNFQSLYTLWYGDFLQNVPIQAETLSRPVVQADQQSTAMAFSGGVDSFYTLWSLMPAQCPLPSMQVKYALMLTRALAEEDAAKHTGEQQLIEWFTPMLAGIGVELIEVRTNWRRFHARDMSLLVDYGTELYAAAAGLSPLFHTFHVAQGNTYDNLLIDGTSPLTMPLLSLETLEFFAHGCEARRIDKLRAIKDWVPALDGIVVCWDEFRKDFTLNCGICPKCLRNRMAMEVVGMTGKVRTMPAAFGTKDILRWGRWLETGLKWDMQVLQECKRTRRELLPAVRLALVIGYVRSWLKKILPNWLKQKIYQKTALPMYRHLLGITPLKDAPTAKK